MKNLIKKGWFWIIICLMVIIIILIAFSLKKDSEGLGTPGISKKEYEKINIGMSQYEVDSIIDELDEWDDDAVYEKCCEEVSKESNDHKYTYQYKYYGEKSGYAIITYQADYSNGSYFETPEVIKKENYNLK